MVFSGLACTGLLGAGDGLVGAGEFDGFEVELVIQRLPLGQQRRRRTTRPARRSRLLGDANLLNWLHDGEAYVADFEFSGFSDVAVDAADLIEHISARTFPGNDCANAERDLGVTRDNRARFNAARRTIALWWLAVLCKQRTSRIEEFAEQHERVRALQS